MGHIERTVFPLRLKPKKGGSVKAIDSFVDQFHPDAAEPVVYVVHKILKKRTLDGEIQYRVKWQGFKQSESTWEPAENLLEWGAADIVKEYEEKHNGAFLAFVPSIADGGVYQYMA